MGFRKISRDPPNILDSCGFSERTWFRILKLWRETGDIMNHQPTLRGRLCALDHEDIDSERANVSYKKLKRIAKERNETL
ncbi:hypothetical protein BDR07DRAFT_1430826 [Suillus spraguei]|nr:hypothetical protein BDR07DRAFT_1430826 [Suillus spraguei]